VIDAALPVGLWSPRRRALNLALVAIGAACAVVAALGVRGEGVPEEQVKFALLSVLGAVVAGTGAVGWYLDGRRTVALRARAVLAQYSTLSRLAGGPGPYVKTPAGVLTHERRVAVGGRAVYHRADCPLTVDRPVVELDALASVEGQRPCPVCEP
jgi:hypothetical protein